MAGGAAALGLAGTGASAQQAFFRIGTGGTGGTYYPIGGIIANSVSTATLSASAVATNGSVGNVNAINGGNLESGFSQSDVAFWAHSGTGIYEGKPKVESLRAIARLYPESFHLVARKGSGIRSFTDLKGKRLSLDEPGSGTLVDARLILAAHGMTEKDVRAEYLKPAPSADKLKDGSIDAFFSVTGYPQGAIAELAATAGIELVPIEGAPAEKLVKSYPFFAHDAIPDDAYKGVKGVKTVSVNALWVTSAKQPDAVVYEITKGLWSDKTRQLLDAGHAKGKSIQLAQATTGLGIPLHAGAEKFYREKGVVK